MRSAKACTSFLLPSPSDRMMRWSPPIAALRSPSLASSMRSHAAILCIIGPSGPDAATASALAAWRWPERLRGGPRTQQPAQDRPRLYARAARARRARDRHGVSPAVCAPTHLEVLAAVADNGRVAARSDHLERLAQELVASALHSPSVISPAETDRTDAARIRAAGRDGFLAARFAQRIAAAIVPVGAHASPQHFCLNGHMRQRQSSGSS